MPEEQIQQTPLKAAIEHIRPSNAPQKEKQYVPSANPVKFKSDKSLLDTTPNTQLKPNTVKIDPVDELKRTEIPDVPKTEQTKVEPTSKTAEPKLEQKAAEPIVPKGVSVKETDYTGYSEQEQTILKNMSVQSREHVMKLMKEKKELEGYKNSQYMQHPSAYILDPTYTQLQEDVFYYSKELEHWQQQLINVKNGDKWQPITGWSKDGKPILGKEQEPTQQDEVNISRYINRYDGAVEAKKNELEGFQSNYKSKITADSQAIQEERSRRFGWVNKPELLEGKVDIGNGVIKTVKQIREDIISLFPPYMRNQISTEVAADLFAALQIFSQENRELKAKTANKQVIEDEKSRVEPSSNKSASASGPRVFTRLGHI